MYIWREMRIRIWRELCIWIRWKLLSVATTGLVGGLWENVAAAAKDGMGSCAEVKEGIGDGMTGGAFQLLHWMREKEGEMWCCGKR